MENEVNVVAAHFETGIKQLECEPKKQLSACW